MRVINGLVMPSRSSSPASSQGSIQGLPLELIREIFLFSTALKLERWTGDSPLPPRFSTTALALSHVCAHWHSIALSFPELWASMAVRCPTENIVKLVRLYLERSGETTLLDLALVDKRYRAGPSGEWPTSSTEWEWERCSLSILDLWIPQAHRWVGLDLTLNMSRPSTIPQLLEIPPHSLSNLEKVSMEFTHWDVRDIQRVWDIVHSSDRLQEVHWHPVLLTPPSLTTFHHVTNLFIWEINLEELATLPSLTRLVKFEVIHIEESPMNEVIHLPALEYLCIRGLCVDSRWLFDRISTPRLRHFELKLRHELVDLSAFHQFLIRTSCTLERLRLCTYPSVSSEENFLQFLQLAAPSLVNLISLTFEFRGITETTMNAFLPQSNNGQLFLPGLEELSLLGCHMEDGLVGSTIAARTNAGKPLTALKIRFTNEECHTHLLDRTILGRLMDNGTLKHVYIS
ncbi:hypothetical protein BDN72DRAFT_912350 [Pluteus cervinus]|uniref:Uncharacterized protein n=1 Tax=Pluteus cervinus TaxID=181527 RepID=A0ACD3ASQ9_9AGAR|nr:hypothetical protein BDN72DRAFT_912350 [Pluteus cervinus]